MRVFTGTTSAVGDVGTLRVDLVCVLVVLLLRTAVLPLVLVAALCMAFTLTARPE